MNLSLEEFKNDYDWRSAFNEAMTGSYSYDDDDDKKSHVIDNVNKVYYSAEGENDGAEWIAIVGWDGPGGDFAVMAAGCDYTGWD